MIQINLLPPEYRPRTGTPVARFVSIIVGLVMVLSASGAYAYTHFIELTKVRELRESREDEARAKEVQKERSLKLQKEIDIYEKRRKAIQTINRSRTLWSRKLDQFFDIVTGQEGSETFPVWLEDIEVPVQLASTRRRRPMRKRPGMKNQTPAGEFKFTGYMAMESDAEAPALLSAFHKAITGDPENTGRPTDFFADFQSINNPNIEMLRERTSGREEVELIPPKVGAFSYELKLNPIDMKKKPGKK